MKIQGKWFLGALGTLALFGMASMPLSHPSAIYRPQITEETTVWEIYEKLGKIKLHAPNLKVTLASAEKGKELVEKGVTTNAKGRHTARISAYFKCTSCHNTGRETADLALASPEQRLAYAQANGTPLLPASSFFGLVNRERFFNDEYQKIYADMPEIKPAQWDIRKAIQLCATQFSKGRTLEEWETESIVRYLWTLQLRLKDLSLSPDDWAKVEGSYNDGQSSARAIHILEDEFVDKTPAHFVEAPPFRPLAPSDLRNAEQLSNGKVIYQQACLHCHQNKRYSNLALDTSATKRRYLTLKMETETSVYQLVRHGSTPSSDKKPAMPPYSLEKMSATQLEDLRVYIEAGAQQ